MTVTEGSLLIVESDKLRSLTGLAPFALVAIQLLTNRTPNCREKSSEPRDALHREGPSGSIAQYADPSWRWRSRAGTAPVAKSPRLERGALGSAPMAVFRWQVVAHDTEVALSGNHMCCDLLPGQPDAVRGIPGMRLPLADYPQMASANYPACEVA